MALSTRASDDDKQLGPAILARVEALSRAHELTLPDLRSETATETSTTFADCCERSSPPHQLNEERLSISGDDVALSGSALTSIALLLHELTTNAAKYGALSTAAGRLQVAMRVVDEPISSRLDRTKRSARHWRAIEPRLRKRSRSGCASRAARHIVPPLGPIWPSAIAAFSGRSVVLLIARKALETQKSLTS